MARKLMRSLVDQQNRVLEAEFAGDAATPRGRKRLARERERLGALLRATGGVAPVG